MPLDENLRAIEYMLRNDPLPVLGFIFFFIGGVFALHITLTLNRAKLFGFRDWRSSAGVYMSSRYLRVAKEKGWAKWPAYAAWLCYLFGALLLLVGLFRWGK